MSEKGKGAADPYQKVYDTRSGEVPYELYDFNDDFDWDSIKFLARNTEQGMIGGPV